MDSAAAASVAGSGLGAPAKSVIAHLTAAAAATPGKRVFTFLDDAGRPTASLTYGALEAATRNLSLALLGGGLTRGVPPLARGDSVLLVFLPSLDFIVAFLACLRAGIVAVPVYPPDPRNLRAHTAQFAAVAAACGARVALTHGTYQSAVSLGRLKDAATKWFRRGGGSSDASWPELTWVATDAPGAAAAAAERALSLPVLLDACGPGEVAFLQFTSGSTSLPKGVVVTHGCLAANLRAIVSSLAASPATVVASWLPQYHDMGLIGSYLGVLACGGSGVYMSPLSFLRDPLLWLRAITAYGASHVQAPNFAYALTARRVKEAVARAGPGAAGALAAAVERRRAAEAAAGVDPATAAAAAAAAGASPPPATVPPGSSSSSGDLAALAAIDLRSLRHCFNAAEPVTLAAVVAWCGALGVLGASPAALAPGYGLAEHTVYASDGGSFVAMVNRRALEGEGRAELLGALPLSALAQDGEGEAAGAVEAAGGQSQVGALAAPAPAAGLAPVAGLASAGDCAAVVALEPAPAEGATGPIPALSTQELLAAALSGARLPRPADGGPVPTAAVVSCGRVYPYCSPPRNPEIVVLIVTANGSAAGHEAAGAPAAAAAAAGATTSAGGEAPSAAGGEAPASPGEAPLVLGEGRVGEIWIAGPSKAAGYWGKPEATAEAFEGRVGGLAAGVAEAHPHLAATLATLPAPLASLPFLRTGDLGFVLRGELFVTGRCKDLIILRGRNLYPQDVEGSVEDAGEGALRRGCTAAFAIEGALATAGMRPADDAGGGGGAGAAGAAAGGDAEAGEALIVVTEVRPETPKAALEGLAARAREACIRNHGMLPAAILLLRAHTLRKTTSGKVARRWNALAYRGLLAGDPESPWVADPTAVLLHWRAPLMPAEGSDLMGALPEAGSCAGADDAAEAPAGELGAGTGAPAGDADGVRAAAGTGTKAGGGGAAADPAGLPVPPAAGGLAAPGRYVGLTGAALLTQLRRDLGGLVGLDPRSVPPTAALQDLGLDSLSLTQLAPRLRSEYGLQVGDEQVFSEACTLAWMVTNAEALRAGHVSLPEAAAGAATGANGAAAAGSPAALAGGAAAAGAAAAPPQGGRLAPPVLPPGAAAAAVGEDGGLAPEEAGDGGAALAAARARAHAAGGRKQPSWWVQNCPCFLFCFDQ